MVGCKQSAAMQGRFCGNFGRAKPRPLFLRVAGIALHDNTVKNQKSRQNHRVFKVPCENVYNTFENINNENYSYDFRRQVLLVGDY